VAARRPGSHAGSSKPVNPPCAADTAPLRALTAVPSFYRLAKERIPYPTQRYVGETERLYGILDARLANNEYLVGNKYSIADIASFSWVNVAYFAGVQLYDFPNLHKWWQRINSRPAVQRGTAVPSESQLVNARYQERLKSEPEFKEKEDELAELGRKAKEQYSYKYSSP